MSMLHDHLTGFQLKILLMSKDVPCTPGIHSGKTDFAAIKFDTQQYSIGEQSEW